MSQHQQQTDQEVLEQASKDQKISVREGSGFLYMLMLNQKLNYSPDEVWQVLTDPNAPDVFRSIKSCTFRKILSDDNNGRRKIHVGHRAVAKFLFLSISFDTSLYVWEDDNTKTINFKNAQEGFMKKFDGSWRIQPFTRQAIESTDKYTYNPTSPAGRSYPLNWLANNLFSPSNASSKTASWVTLEQSILPKAPAPPGVKQLIKGLCAKQLQNMIEDLDAELYRRKNKCDALAKGSSSQGPAASSAASITMSGQQRLADLWENSAPLVNIVVKL